MKTAKQAFVRGSFCLLAFMMSFGALADGRRESHPVSDFARIRAIFRNRHSPVYEGRHHRERHRRDRHHEAPPVVIVVPSDERQHDEGSSCWASATSREKIGVQLVRYVSDCVPGRTNQIARTKKAFPLMGGRSYEASYWTGSFKRRAILRDVIFTTYESNCTGYDPIRSLSDEYEGDYHFEVENSNLSDEVSRSFELAPMTEAEAADALDQAWARCLLTE